VSRWFVTVFTEARHWTARSPHRHKCLIGPSQVWGSHGLWSAGLWRRALLQKQAIHCSYGTIRRHNPQDYSPYFNIVPGTLRVSRLTICTHLSLSYPFYMFCPFHSPPPPFHSVTSTNYEASHCARFAVLTAVKMTTMSFWVVKLCGLGETDCIFSPDDGGRMFFRNAGIYVLVHTVSRPRRTTSASQYADMPSILPLAVPQHSYGVC
jgi:hypothetical protein